MRSLILMFALCACGPIVNTSDRCFGESGLEYIGEDGINWNCNEFRKADSITVKRLPLETIIEDDRLKTVNLAGWKLAIHAGETFISPNGIKVLGLTYCENRVMVISDRPFKQSAFVHEICHALQNCSAQPPLDKDDPDHSNWGRNGIFEGIMNVKYPELK